ncbi:GntR family transcriptional regulator [Anaerovorax odorimutans]|uniref:GntR family transcriptional regulator n=1 Tax=Anaerovorax odorimutans TaxID=109327 RepID=A0ABT1RMC6_9FIRM|nr:GntR family transcriptional regulator [Anaerovorax odorimutans]MCQ4636327.1 GntR family transcriptional regulator [Anaerovorax odorimutans]
MKIDSELYKLVYEYYETRILFGFYTCGDSLPSIPKICAMFRMAPATVRSALSLLQKNGYIRTDARKAAKVTYHAQPGQLRENAAKYFVPRKAGIIDLTQSGQILFEPFWEEGLRRWSEEDWQTLLREMEEPLPGAISVPAEFYILTLSTLNNSLVLNLYWEMLRYIRFPYLAGGKDEERVRYETAGKSHEEIITFLKEEFSQSYGEAVEALFAFIDQADGEYFEEPPEQIPFKWNIYRQRPQLRYTLASRIIREIMNGSYPVGSYLPSLPKMARKYGVSQNTVRRTLSLLEGTGITKSFQGKGTLISMEPIQINLSAPGMEEGYRLYLESLQLLAMTVRQVTALSLRCASRKKREELARRFCQIREEKKSFLCFEVLFAFVEAACPLNMVRECYSKIGDLLAWGYPLAFVRLKKKNLHAEYAEINSRMEEALKKDDIETFAATWESHLRSEEKQAVAFLEHEKQVLTY